MRRQQLTEAQIAALFDPLTDPRELVRHYTLSETDIATIRRCRGDHSRLGYALMLCYLRYPGRPLRVSERPPAALVSFVAEQIDVRPETIDDYLVFKQNRRRHAAELQDRLRLRPFGTRPAAELAGWLLPRGLRMTGCLIWPSWSWRNADSAGSSSHHPGALNASASTCAIRRGESRTSADRRVVGRAAAAAGCVTQRRAETSQSWLVWLRQMPEATKPAAMLGLIERLGHVRAIGLDPARGHRVHQARLAQLVREASRTTAQHVAGYERQRRHATLVAVTLDLIASLTDQAIDLFDRLVGTMFRKAEGRHARAFQADGRAINEKVRLYARVGTALIAARDKKEDAFDAITAVIPWDRFRASVAEAEALARSEEFDSYQMLGEHYAGVRRWSPAFLATFAFQGVGAASLLRAINMLRDMNTATTLSLQKSAPTGFIRERWARHVLIGGAIDRRYYELVVVGTARSTARRRIWVGRAAGATAPSKMPHFPRDLEGAGTERHRADRGRYRFRALPIAARRALLDERLAAIDAKAKGGLLPNVTIEKGVLKITPIEKSTRPEAEAMAARLYAMLPRIRITDLFSEVARWTLFTDCFTHLRSGETVADPRVLMASLRRRAQSRPDAHGRGLHDRQPRQARLGG